MGRQTAILRELLRVTQKMHAKVQEIGSHALPEQLPLLFVLRELLANRQELIDRLKTLSPEASAGEPPEERGQLLAALRELNTTVAAELSARREELAASLRKVRQGKEALTSLRVLSAQKGELLDQRQ
ncbi:MAG TPA: hypothetical protein EYP63_07560 [Desulfotomaculum sp.]|nr:hypothetical protein [Desulfotomaculum sp.]